MTFGKLLSIITILFLTTAWTWGWGGEVKDPKSSTKKPVTAQKTIAKKTSSKKAEPEKVRVLPEPKKLSAMEILDGETKKPKPAVPAPLEKAPQTVTPPSAAKPVVSSQIPTAPVQTDVRQIMKLNQDREKELTRQRKSIQEATQQAQFYNKMLAQMRPITPTKAPASLMPKSLNQEKIRLIHQEAKQMNPSPTTVRPSVPSPVTPKNVLKPEVKAKAPAVVAPSAPTSNSTPTKELAKKLS